jgi:hypothetical protein
MSESGGETVATARQRQLVERALGEWQGEAAGRVIVVTGGARGIGLPSARDCCAPAPRSLQRT